MAEAALLAGLARLGPHFALEVYPAVPDAGWRPFDALLADLDARVAQVRAALAAASGCRPAEVEPRVAVSMTQLGLTGRLVCPALGVALLTGGPLELDPTRLRWRPGPGGTVALSVPADAIPGGAIGSGRPLPTDRLAEDLADGLAGNLADGLAEGLAGSLLAGPVGLLVEAAGRYRVSPRVLWGNVASVLHSIPALVGTNSPGLLGQAEALVAGMLDRPPLRGTFRGGPAATFRRRSCCLVYRLVPADQAGSDARRGICGDCVLRR